MNDERTARALLRLQHIMRILRGPEGCPWDAQQTTRSLKPYLLEEAYEVLDAIDRADPEEICTELGDLLLQVVFHAQIFAEQQRFDLADVATAISTKLERRHPHVFGDVEETDLDRLSAQWDRIKAQEKGVGGHRNNPLDVPPALPALLRAGKILDRSTRAGFTQPSAETNRTRLIDLADRLCRSETGDDPEGAEQIFGELLLTATALGRNLGLDGEEALRGALNRYQAGLAPPPAGGADEGSSAGPRPPEPGRSDGGKRPPQEG